MVKRRYGSLILISILLLLILSACNQPAPKEETEPPQDQTPPPMANEPTPPPKPAYTSPLTGLPGDKPFTNRIYMVMVENAPAARPQSGLDKADIVYEILAEGGITRFAAFYQSEYPENVGPVRSIRPYFLELGGGYDAIFVHAGGSEEAKSQIAKKGLPSLDGLYLAPKYFWRSSFRKAPHNLYTDFTKLQQAAAAYQYRPEGEIPAFYFHHADDQVTGEEAKKITIKYNPSYTVEYGYDDATKTYLRSMDGKAHMDLTTDKQLSATNLLVIETKHRTLDREGRLAVDLKSGGSGTLFERGVAIPIRWENVKGIIRAYTHGNEIKFDPGKTWVEIIPNAGTTLSYE